MKTDETTWKPPLLREPHPLSTNTPIPEQFFHDPPLCPNLKDKNPPPLILGGGGNYDIYVYNIHVYIICAGEKGLS